MSADFDQKEPSPFAPCNSATSIQKKLREKKGISVAKTLHFSCWKEGMALGALLWHY